MICEDCDSQIVTLLNADFACDCALRRLERIASPWVAETLRRAMAFQRAQYPTCDRCDTAEADGLTRCHLGCTHAQCLDCARLTNEERRRTEHWAAYRLNGMAPGPCPESTLHPAKLDDRRELLRRLA